MNRIHHLTRACVTLVACFSLVAFAWAGTATSDDTTIAPQADGRSQVKASYPQRTLSQVGRGSVQLALDFLSDEDYDAAADAFLKAYRANPCQFDTADLVAFQKTKRMPELVECFDASAFQKMLSPERQGNRTYHVFELLKAVMTDAQVKDERFRILLDVFVTVEPWYQYQMLKRPKEYNIVWKDVPDPMPFLRAKLIPDDFRKERAGWDRFSIKLFSYDERPSTGLLTLMRPLFHNKQILRRIADEVRELRAKHKSWKAGALLQIVLAAELGNHQQAIKLANENLFGPTSHLIPHSSKWMLGMALRDRDESLRPIATRLLEESLRAIVDKQRYQLVCSPLNELAELYQQQGKKSEARQLIYGLVNTKDQHPTVRGYKPSTIGGCSRTEMRCNQCHIDNAGRNLDGYKVASRYLLDFGYPVDALLSIARTDESFGHAFRSSPKWIDTSTEEGKSLESWARVWESNLREYTQPAEAAVTPRKVIEAMDQDTFQRWAPATQDDAPSSVMELMLSIRGEGPNAKPTVFSPVIDILKLAMKSKGPQAEKDIAELDTRLRLQSEANPTDVQAAVASTVFAFLRDDLDVAQKRLKRLTQLAESSGQKTRREDATLWLAAREALKHESTKEMAIFLGLKASVATKTKTTSRISEVIRREYSERVGQKEGPLLGDRQP